jgi:predicted nucleotidyltransferase
MSEPRGDVETLLARVLAPAPPGLVSAYLFGGHAAGRAHRDSDVDVGVLLDWAAFPTSRDRFEERVRLTSELMAALAAPRVDVVVLNDAPPQLGRRIVTEGRCVCRADPEQDHAYVRDVQLRAADVEPFLRRMRRLKLDALAR